MEAVESGPVRQCPPGLIYLETVVSRSLDPKPSCHITDGPPLVPDVFPGDAAESAATIGDFPAARKEAVHHGWRVLATLSTLGTP